MKKLFVFLLLFSGLRMAASAQTVHFDHIGLYVRNLDSSAAFYAQLFPVDTVANPWKNFRVKWFRLSDGVQLHLVEGLKTSMTGPIMSHLSFSVPDFNAFRQLLDRLQVPYYNGNEERGKFNQRADGVKQLLFRDPDGYWLEVNDQKH